MAQPNFELSDWMGDLQEFLNEHPLSRIVVPGAHDAGSFSLTTKEVAPFAPKCTQSKVSRLWSCITRPWAVTQGDNYTSMMNNGCRYFDTRVCWDEKRNSIRTEHSLLGMSLEALFSQVKRFVEAHPKEMVILHLRHFRYKEYYDMPEEKHKELLELILKVFGEEMLVQESEWNSPMQDLWAKGRKVMIFYAHKVQEVYESYRYVVPRCRIHGELWCNAQNLQKLEQKLDEYCTKCEGMDIFYKLEACMTPNTNFIVRGIISCIFYPIFRFVWCPLFRPKHLREVAKLVAPTLEKWVIKQKEAGKRINIVSFDGFSDVEIAKSMIELNIQKEKEGVIQIVLDTE